MLVIHESARPRLREAYEHAKRLGPDIVKQFLKTLLHYNEYGARIEGGVDPVARKECEFILYPDFAPYSFSIVFKRRGRFIFNGGLIYQGPDSPADGSGPSFTVSLSRNVGWFVHT